MIDSFILFKGTNVLKIKALDKEEDPITYELGADAQGRFKINSLTGQITANVVLDREVNQTANTFKICCFCTRFPIPKPREFNNHGAWV